jgi:hypothetical protein
MAVCLSSRPTIQVVALSGAAPEAEMSGEVAATLFSLMLWFYALGFKTTSSIFCGIVQKGIP